MNGPTYGVMSLLTLRYLAHRARADRLRDDVVQFLTDTADMDDAAVVLTATKIAILETDDDDVWGGQAGGEVGTAKPGRPEGGN